MDRRKSIFSTRSGPLSLRRGGKRSSPRRVRRQREHLPVHRSDVNMGIIRRARSQQMPGIERIFPRDLATGRIDRIEHTTHASDENLAAAKTESAVVDHAADVALPE